MFVFIFHTCPLQCYLILRRSTDIGQCQGHVVGINRFKVSPHQNVFQWNNTFLSDIFLTSQKYINGCDARAC